MGDAAEVFRSKERQGILAALKEAARSMSVPEIMAATERRDRKATEMLLYKMEKDGEVVHAKRGHWRHPDVPPDDDPPIDAVGIVGKVVKRGQPTDTRREKRSKNTNANTNASEAVGIHPNANTNASETVGIGVGISEPHKQLKHESNSAHCHDPNDTNGTEHSGPSQIAAQSRNDRKAQKRKEGAKRAAPSPYTPNKTNGGGKPLLAVGSPEFEEKCKQVARMRDRLFFKYDDDSKVVELVRAQIAKDFPQHLVDAAYDRMMNL
jgi:hypothetical protein